MRLLVDTGASLVLLPYEEVAALGLDPASLSFSLPVSTAIRPLPPVPICPRISSSSLRVTVIGISVTMSPEPISRLTLPA